MVTYMSRYLPYVRELHSTLCQGERHGVGRGDNGDINEDRNGEGRPAGTERDREQKKGRKAQPGRAAGFGDKKASIGGGCVGVPGLLRGGGCRLGSAPTTFITDITEDCSWR